MVFSYYTFIAAVASPFRSLTTREVPRRILLGSPSFRERLPHMAESRRFDETAVAAQMAAFAVWVVDLLGDS